MTELRRGRQTTIEATPEPITIDTARTAVIVVDMQNDFGTRAECSIAPESTSLRFRKLLHPSRKFSNQPATRA